MNKSVFEINPLTRTIVLIGMMGAGKTSLGRSLAGLFAVPFIDADAEIEAAAGCSVPEIFAHYGESEFRRMERHVIARLLDGAPCILSLGGGAFMNEETRKRIKKKAVSVWIKVAPELLLERVLRHGNRPLLKEGDPREKMTTLLSEREPVYALADITVMCDDHPVTQNAHKIKDALTSYLRHPREGGDPSSSS